MSFERTLTAVEVELFGNNMALRSSRRTKRLLRGTSRLARFEALAAETIAAGIEPGTPEQHNLVAALWDATAELLDAAGQVLAHQATLKPVEAEESTLTIVNPPLELLAPHAPPAGLAPVPVPWGVRAA